VVSALDTLIADMEDFSNKKTDEEKTRDLETKVDMLTDKLKEAFDPNTDMTNFRWSVSEPAEEVCGGCKAALAATTSVLVGEKKYHPDCFTCFHCQKRLESRYYQVDGNNYCEADKDVALPVCSSCNLPLKSGSLTVNGETFHPECFVCSICTHPIMGKFFTTEEGKHICEEDYKQTKEKCHHCKLPMLDRILTVEEKKFHPACFRCVGCDTCLDGSEFLSTPEGYLCPGCYNTSHGLVCQRCQAGIVGGNTTSIITCEGKHYHTHCYMCRRCDVGLAGQHVFMDQVEQDVICKDCHLKE